MVHLHCPAVGGFIPSIAHLCAISALSVMTQSSRSSRTASVRCLRPAMSPPSVAVWASLRMGEYSQATRCHALLHQLLISLGRCVRYVVRSVACIVCFSTSFIMRMILNNFGCTRRNSHADTVELQRHPILASLLAIEEQNSI